MVNFTDIYETNVSYQLILDDGIPVMQVVLPGHVILNGTFFCHDTKRQLVLCICHIEARHIERQKIENHCI